MGRNWQWSYQQGRQARLDAELAAHQSQQPCVASPGLHSHDGTMQSKFEQGWASVTPVEIQRYLKPSPSVGELLRSNTRLRTALGL